MHIYIHYNTYTYSIQIKLINSPKSLLFFFFEKQMVSEIKISKYKFFSSHVNSPGKLLSLRLIVDLLHGHLPLLTPSNRDARVQVVELGRAQGYLLVLLLWWGKIIKHRWPQDCEKNKEIDSYHLPHQHQPFK